MYKLLPVFIVAIILSSCGTTKNSGLYHEKSVENQGIKTDHYHADMEIDESKKINGNGTATYFIFFKISGDNHFADFDKSSLFPNAVDKVKAAAKYDAIKSSDADFIAKPMYTTTIQSWFFGVVSTVTANVSGYGGVYKNFKQVDPFERDLENAVNKKLVDKLNLNK